MRNEEKYFKIFSAKVVLNETSKINLIYSLIKIFILKV